MAGGDTSEVIYNPHGENDSGNSEQPPIVYFFEEIGGEKEKIKLAGYQED
jgi:hypothetical protein